jgi:hypothetical protein
MMAVNPGKVKVTAFFDDKPSTVHNRTSVLRNVVIKAGRVTKRAFTQPCQGA